MPDTGPRTPTDRELTLSFLDRQSLLARRASADCAALVRSLVGLQAQYSPSPYLALAARMAGFAVGDLERCLASGTVVKSTLMRGTLHLTAAADHDAYARIWRQDATRHWLGRYPGLDHASLARGLAEYTRTPRGTDEIRARVAELDGGLVAPRERLHVARALVPMVHAVPSGYWRAHGKPALTAWSGDRTAEPSPADVGLLLRRYLAGYGPAGRADAARYTGLPARTLERGLESAGPLITRTGPDGRELLDLPDAPFPAEDVPIPFRLLPKWDSALLGHDRRDRVIDDRLRPLVVSRANGDMLATYLVDGRVAGTWRAVEEGGAATIELSPLTNAEPGPEAEAEAFRVLRLLHPHAAERRLVVRTPAAAAGGRESSP